MQEKYNEAAAKLARLEAEVVPLTAAHDAEQAKFVKLGKRLSRFIARQKELPTLIKRMRQEYRSDTGAVAVGSLPEGAHIHWRQDIRNAEDELIECGFAIELVTAAHEDFRWGELAAVSEPLKMLRAEIKRETAYLELLDEIKPLIGIERRSLMQTEQGDGKRKVEWQRYAHDSGSLHIQPW